MAMGEWEHIAQTPGSRLP